MPLTRHFRSTALDCAQNDARFREALFTKAINAYLAGDTRAGKVIRRDLVNATIGFEGLAAEINKPSKSLHACLPRTAIQARRFFRHRDRAAKEDACEVARDDQGRVKVIDEIIYAIMQAGPEELVRFARFACRQ